MFLRFVGAAGVAAAAGVGGGTAPGAPGVLSKSGPELLPQPCPEI